MPGQAVLRNSILGTACKSVVFDVDDTLTEGNSWLQLTAGLGASESTHMELFSALKDRRIDNQEASIELLGLWQRTGKASKSNIRNIFERIRLRPHSAESIGTLRALGHTVCLISGSMDMFVESVAERLSVPTWYSNGKLTFDSRGYLAGLQYTEDQESLKLKQIKELAATLGEEVRQICVVGDGSNDELLFANTDCAIQVGTANGPTPVDGRHLAASLLQVPRILRAPR